MIKLKKDVVSVVINVVCTLICAMLAGCRISVGKFHLEDVSGELFSTNTFNFVER